VSSCRARMACVRNMFDNVFVRLAYTAAVVACGLTARVVCWRAQ